jgi:hypothetical protein
VRKRENAGMRDLIKAAFESAIKVDDARAKAATEARKQKSADRQHFENDYNITCDRVIIPALREVMTVLRAAIWNCDIADKGGAESRLESLIHGRSITLSIFKGVFIWIAGRARGLASNSV